VSTTTTNPGGTGTPTFPLPPDVRTAYEDTYAKLQTAIENSADPVLLTLLNDSRMAIADVITADNQYRISQDDASFAALNKKFTAANDSLKTLQAQMEGIAKKVGAVASALAAVNKLVSLVPHV
jgi:septal ring factor EnvC (AmiA/AmiB activator)